jgi:diguanylate cyclase (GGDEF)-like protein
MAESISIDHGADHPALLTGQAGRTQLLEHVRYALAGLSDDRTLIVVALKLDNFHELTVARGDATGEIVLVEVANRLLTQIPLEETLIWGTGDEFVVTCELLESPLQIQAFQSRVESCFDEAFMVANTPVYISASMGVSFATGAADDPHLLVGTAEVACTEAIRDGNNRLVVFDSRARHRIRDRFEMSQDLNAAIRYRELELEYHPIVDLKIGTPVGLGAQVCWQPRGQPRVPNDVFIQCAESSGLMSEIGSWSLNEIRRQWSAIPEGDGEDPLSLIIQVTGDQLGAWLAGAPDDLAAASTALHGRLSMEVSDSRLARDDQTAGAVLGWLNDNGVGIIIGVFGSGYESLRSLRSFSVDALKISRSFIEPLPESARDRLMVKKIIELAHAFGVIAIADGVESDEQMECLAELECDQAHAYNLSGPLPIEGALGVVRSRT